MEINKKCSSDSTSVTSGLSYLSTQVIYIFLNYEVRPIQFGLIAVGV